MCVPGGQAHLTKVLVKLSISFLGLVHIFLFHYFPTYYFVSVFGFASKILQKRLFLFETEKFAFIYIFSLQS